ncbi:MAG: hypothetical protein KAX84_03590 [Burkholderiales bacterium]|nr:hypothetical protein [Betaproteobacteria bacterium]MBK9607771.1 hypothetical protein [Betaproteobacteria bacterium]MBP8295164.1 hypothetical protein [Burkholderiales bacterium]
MNQPSPFPNACIYALRLHTPTTQVRAEDMPAVSGQLEHVISGRRHEFNTGEQLLACLALELARAATAAAPQPE